MHVAMTGGAGLVGSHLLERLVRDGHDIVVIGMHGELSQHAMRAAADGRVRFVRDACLAADLGPTLTAETRVVLLGYLSTGPTGRRAIADDLAREVAMNRAVLRAAHGVVAHVVYGSSTSVYGLPTHTPIEESERTSPLTPEAKASVASERVLRCVARAWGFSATILRIATVFGPGENSSAVVDRLVRAGIDGAQPEIDGDGLDEDDYVHVDDVVDATVRALERQPDATYNVATGVATPTLTLARAVFELVHADVEPVHQQPRRPARVRIAYSTARAATELGCIAWPNLHQGLLDQIAWMRGASQAAQPPPS